MPQCATAVTGTVVSTVEVGDLFGTRRYDLKALTKLCLPAAKSGAPTVLAGPSVADLRDAYAAIGGRK